MPEAAMEMEMEKRSMHPLSVLARPEKKDNSGSADPTSQFGGSNQ